MKEMDEALNQFSSEIESLIKDYPPEVKMMVLRTVIERLSKEYTKAEEEFEKFVFDTWTRIFEIIGKGHESDE